RTTRGTWTASPPASGCNSSDNASRPWEATLVPPRTSQTSPRKTPLRKSSSSPTCTGVRWSPAADDKDLAGLSDSLCGGSGPVFLDLLHWILSNASLLTTRVYLSRYLSPVRLPPEFENDATHELLETLAEYQAEFRDAHASHEEAKAGEDVPLSTVQGEIVSMEAEVKQLSERLARERSKLEKRPSRDKGGELLLAASREMREAQDKEAELEGRLFEEDHRRRSADGKMKRVGQMRNAGSAMQTRNPDTPRSTGPHWQKLDASRETERFKVDDDALVAGDAVDHLAEVAAGLEDEISKKKSDLERTGVEVSDSISRLQRTAGDALASLKSARADVDRMRAHAEYFRSSIKSLQASIDEQDSRAPGLPNLPNSGGMDGAPNLAELQGRLDGHLVDYCQAKDAIASVRRELRDLEEEEEAARRGHSETLLVAAENEGRKRDIEAYLEMNETLRRISADTALSNKSKQGKLEQVNAIVERIVAFQNGERRATLGSKIDSLKESRKRLEEAEARRSDVRNKQADCETEPIVVLEEKVSSLQRRWLGKERKAAAVCDGSLRIAPVVDEDDLREMYEFVPSLPHDSSACGAHGDGRHQRTQFEKLKDLLEIKAAAVGVLTS
ncbi:hypothetical protein THAOC_20496, partial [Thalassiosira oceanica]